MLDSLEPPSALFRSSAGLLFKILRALFRELAKTQQEFADFKKEVQKR